jgi:SWIM zinc finger
MEMREFLVQGSSPEPYKVTFTRDGSNLSAYCTCPAGENGMYCKHRFNILKGSSKGIISPNIADVEIVASWLVGTDVEAAIKTVKNFEKEVEQIKKQLSAAKKELARAMRT